MSQPCVLIIECVCARWCRCQQHVHNSQQTALDRERLDVRITSYCYKTSFLSKLRLANLTPSVLWLTLFVGWQEGHLASKNYRRFFFGRLLLEPGVSLHFNGRFSRWTSVSWFYWRWGWWRRWRQLELYDVQSSSQIVTTNKPIPNFLQARCPSCRPINSVKVLKGSGVICRKTH